MNSLWLPFFRLHTSIIVKNKNIILYIYIYIYIYIYTCSLLLITTHLSIQHSSEYISSEYIFMFCFSTFACSFLICDFNLSSHLGFNFLSVFRSIPIFSLTNIAPAYIKSFNSLLLLVGNKSFTFSVSDFIVPQSKFLREDCNFLFRHPSWSSFCVLYLQCISHYHLAFGFGKDFRGFLYLECWLLY